MSGEHATFIGRAIGFFMLSLALLALVVLGFSRTFDFPTSLFYTLFFSLLLLLWRVTFGNLRGWGRDLVSLVILANSAWFVRNALHLVVPFVFSMAVCVSAFEVMISSERKEFRRSFLRRFSARLVQLGVLLPILVGLEWLWHD